MGYWTIDFQTFSNAHITIEIDGYSGNGNKALQPAANPFSTTEEGDEDLFVPVKTQSGYIRIVTDDIYTVRDIIPSSGGSRTVTVYQDNSTVWQGFVQPKLLNFNIWQGEQVVAIPVECCLSALRYQTAGTTTNYPYMNELMVMMMTQFNLRYWYFQCASFTGGNVNSDYLWLNKRIPSSNVGGRSYLDILKDICNFYGWTCRTCGRDIYFLKNRNIDSVISDELYRGTTTTVSRISGQPILADGVEWESMTLINGAFADNRPRMILTDGVHRVVLTSELIPYDLEVATNVSRIKEAIYDGDWNPQRIDVDDTYYYEAFNDITIDDMIISGFNAYGELGPVQPGQTDVQTRTLKMHVLITDKYSAVPYLGWMTFTTTGSYSFSPGRISFKFEDASTVVEFTIKIGNLWYKWNGNGMNGEWVSSEPTDVANHISFDPSSELGNEAVIFLKENLTGPVTIKVYDPSGLTGAEDLTFSNVIMTYTAQQDEDYSSDKTEMKYTQLTDVDFEGDKELESRFILKENTLAMSQNILLNADLTPCESLYNYPSSPVAFNPLQSTVDAAAAELSAVGEMIEVNLLENIQGSITPLTQMYVSPLSAYYYPVSISHEWRDDIVKLKLLKRINHPS